MEKFENSKKWEQCKKIGKEIVNELSKKFSGGTITYDMKFLRERGINVFGITLEYEGLIVAITAQDRKEYDKPFIYMDEIKTQGESRGKGLAVKALDSISSLVENRVFEHLNVKDMSGGFWQVMMKRYGFIRDKYTTGYDAG